MISSKSIQLLNLSKHNKAFDLIRKHYIPKLPLDGKLDLTYRCNNDCRHCWLWLPPGAKEKQEELSFDELKRIVNEARQMGTQAWHISGGEPMLRPDFYEIFDFLTRKSVTFSLNTNGTLITPRIAKLLTRKGRKMVAIYGATADVHDHVTRNTGSFDAAMRGIAYLKEAGAFFTIQIIPMRVNFHQYEKMLKLAQTLSKDYRVGASWLYLSANHSITRNLEIKNQRLDPSDVIFLDQPNPVRGIIKEIQGNVKLQNDIQCNHSIKDDQLFATCIAARRDFHIDPYGGMSFCPFIKDPALRFDLRKGSFQEAWDEFIPSISNMVCGNQEYKVNCGSCDLRQDCHWCPVYAYLEHGRFSAKIDYLCQIAKETHEYKENWKMNHKRYYQIAGITIMVHSDMPITENTFLPVFKIFEVDKPGSDLVTLHLVPSIPPLSELNLGKEVFRRPPWAIYRQRDGWVYISLPAKNTLTNPMRVLIFNDAHTRGTIFSKVFADEPKNLRSLSTFTTDQILLARLLADRKACFIHSAGIAINGQGFLFVGHSEAGKSTMMKMLRDHGEILGDDRNIIRKWPEGFQIHGSWSHGELPDVSPHSTPLRAILFLEQASTNEIIPITDQREKLGKILAHVIKGLITDDWWDKILDLAGQISSEVPIYQLKFDKSGQVADKLKEMFM